MSIANRVEKLRYLAQEIELTHRITLAQPTEYLKRAAARRVIIRVKDFITHARQLPKPLKGAGYDPAEFKERKEVYAKTFETYYQAQRDRIGAHVQDIEMLERLELWTDIEVTKLNYFVDGARELYVDSLGALPLSEYLPFESFPELRDDEFTRALAEHAAAAPELGVTIGVSAFAGSKPNTVWTLECHPIQQRAAQLVALDEWVRAGTTLLERVACWPNASRSIRAQLLTDAVSFADCLVTRVDAGPKQQMLGLDDLVRADRQGDVTAIDDLRRVFRFDDKLRRLRAVRNRVGGHLDDESSDVLADLLRELDELPPLEVRRFYEKLWATFRLTCHRTHFLGQYLQNGVRLSRVLSASAHEFVRPFDPKTPPPATLERKRQDYTDESLRAAFDAAVRDERAEGRDVLSDAFMQAEVVDHYQLDGRDIPVRTAHRMLLERVVTGPSPEERLPFFALAESCGSGSPDPLAATLVRALEVLHARNDHGSDAAIYRTLGMLPVSSDTQLCALLHAAAGRAEFDVALAAVVSLYRLGGLAALRSRTWPETFFAEHVSPLLSARPASERLQMLLVVAALFPAGELRFEGQAAEREMAVVKAALCTQLGDIARDAVVQRALANLDFVSLAAWLALQFLGGARDAEGQSLLSAVVDGELALPPQIDARVDPLMNLAVACVHAGQRPRASAIAAQLMMQFPARLDLRVRGVGVLIAAGAAPATCAEMLDYIRESYVLDAETMREVDTLSAALVAPRAPGEDARAEP